MCKNPYAPKAYTAGNHNDPNCQYCHSFSFLERVGNTLYFKKEQNALWNGTVELIHADAYLNPAVKSDSMNRASKEFIVEVSMQRM